MKDMAYYSFRRPDVFALIKGTPRRVLEIGSAAGGFRANFGQEVEYWGVEPVQEVAEMSMASLTKVLVGTYDEVSERIPSDYFDLVVCNDVIEHMAFPNRFLTNVSKKLVKGGSLVGSVPNIRYLPVMFSYLVLKDWRYNPNGGVMDDTHLRFFTKKSLIRMLKEVKEFDVSHICYLTAPVHRFAKFVLSLFVWPLGLDVLMGQIGFVAKRK